MSTFESSKYVMDSVKKVKEVTKLIENLNDGESIKLIAMAFDIDEVKSFCNTMSKTGNARFVAFDHGENVGIEIAKIVSPLPVEVFYAFMDKNVAATLARESGKEFKEAVDTVRKYIFKLLSKSYDDLNNWDKSQITENDHSNGIFSHGSIQRRTLNLAIIRNIAKKEDKAEGEVFKEVMDHLAKKEVVEVIKESPLTYRVLMTQ